MSAVFPAAGFDIPPDFDETDDDVTQILNVACESFRSRRSDPIQGDDE